MFEAPELFPTDKRKLYHMLCKMLASLTEGERRPVPNMANAAALLGLALRDINWAGFYTLYGNELVLAPFWGKPACISIPVGRGVCGTAVSERKLQNVPDVRLFSSHIACDAASLSEIVIPLFRGEEIVAVLDIDSPTLSRFTSEDEQGLQRFAQIIQSACDF